MSYASGYQNGYRKAILEKIEQELDSYLESAKEHIIQMFEIYNEDIIEAIEATIDELPMLINQGNEIAQKIVKDRLKDTSYRPEIKDLDIKDLMRALHCSNIDLEDYYNMGFNDGTLEVISVLYKILDKDDKAKEALESFHGG